MRYISRQQFDALVAGGELLRRDRHGPKVYQAVDGRIVKLFRVKRWWSSSMLYPYSWRFQRNSRRLQARGFRCVSVEQIFYCRAIRRHGVIYRRLEGQGLDRLLGGDAETSADLFRRYAAYIAKLHAMRVYFRSLHPGNVLQMPDGGFGLIDIGDMRFPLRPLGIARRRRNFRHLLRSVEFRDALQHHSGQAFIDAYLEAAGLEAAQRDLLAAQLGADFAAVGTATGE